MYYDTPKRIRHFRKKGAQGRPQGIPKKDLHVKKVMLTCFWDENGVVHHEYMPSGQTINAEKYCAILDRVQKAIKEKRPWLVTGGRCSVILQQDNASPHKAKITQKKIKELKWKLLQHPPYSPDLAPSDYHLFRSLANAQQGKKFKSTEEAQNFTDEFLQQKTEEHIEGKERFFRRGIMKLVGRWEQCIAAKGEYFE